MNTDLEKTMVELTRDLILIPSSASRPEARETCMNFIRNHLEEINGVHIREYRSGGYRSLVVLPENVQAPDILFCTHLDVVEYQAAKHYNSTIEDGRIIGPGAGDMKGALALLILLFRNMHKRFPGLLLGLVVTSDEEIGGEHGLSYLFKEIGLKCEAALIPDGGSINQVVVEEKGILHLRLESHGKSTHAARPWLGKNALDRLLQCIAQIQKSFPFTEEENYWVPTCSVTCMNTDNQSINRIPDTANAALDIRFPFPHTTDEMLEKVKAIIPDYILVEISLAAEPARLNPDQKFLDLIKKQTGVALAVSGIRLID